MSKIIIQVSGGIVQAAFLIDKKVDKLEKIIVVDFDTDGNVDEKTTIVNEDLYAYIGELEISSMPRNCDVEKLLKQYNHDKEQIERGFK
jgi:hypothetical protein